MYRLHRSLQLFVYAFGKLRIEMMLQTRNAGLVVIFFSLSCAQNLANWEGSVDAVFRYRPQDSTTAVVEIRPKSFAEKAGLQAGDLIIAIDGKDITGISFEEVRNLLRGPVGSNVRISVKRNESISDVVVERCEIDLKNKKK